MPIAPGARIVVSVAKSDNLGDLLGAVDAAVAARASVVSMSWGTSELTAGVMSYDWHFQVPDVTFIAAVGDSGEAVNWPAASPYVVAVGGTILRLDAIGNRKAAETAWSGSGGGISTIYGLPSFQVGWFKSGWPTSGRGVPDVSYVAAGVGIVYGSSFFSVGGTSVGAPQWAALIALGNQWNNTSLGGANALIYSLAKSGVNPPWTVNSACFYDITSGSNGKDKDDQAGTGYDLVTGLGSPVATGLVPNL